MDAIAIKEAAEAIKTLANGLRGDDAWPFRIEIIDKIIFQADCILNWYLTVDKQSETSPAIDNTRL